MRALVQVSATGKAPETASEGVAAKLKEQAPKFSLERLARIAKRLLETEQQLKTSEGTPLPLELAILDLVTTTGTPAGATPGGRPTASAPARSATTAPAPARSTTTAPPREAPTPIRSVPRSESASIPQRAETSAARSSATAARPVATAARAATAMASAKESGGPIVDLAERRAQAASITLTEVKRAWGELVAEATSSNMGKAAHLNEAEALSVDGTTVVIGFATEFARGYWHDRRRAELERGLSERLSVTLRVRCVVQALAPDAPPASDDPMHRAALEIFRRPDRIMEIE
jgi:DNA polymerase III gamma/tau subunit